MTLHIEREIQLTSLRTHSRSKRLKELQFLFSNRLNFRRRRSSIFPSCSREIDHVYDQYILCIRRTLHGTSSNISSSLKIQNRTPKHGVKGVGTGDGRDAVAEHRTERASLSTDWQVRLTRAPDFTSRTATSAPLRKRGRQIVPFPHTSHSNESPQLVLFFSRSFRVSAVSGDSDSRTRSIDNRRL